MPIYDYLMLLHDNTALAAAGNENTANEVNFGMASPDVGKLGQFGLHLIITQAYTAMNSGVVMWIHHGAATAPTTKLTGRFLSQTQLKVLGAHYFIPAPPGTLLQYARGKMVPVSENGTLGRVTAYFGPDEDGSI